MVVKLAGMAGVLVALAGATGLYLNSHRAVGPPSSPVLGVRSPEVGNQVQLEQLAEQVARLQTELAAAKSQQAFQQNTHVSQSAMARESSSPAESPVDAHAMRAADAERHHEYVAGVAQAFAEEKIEAAWANRVSSRVDAALYDNEVLRGVTRNVDCRQQTCRLEIDDDDSGKVSGQLPLIALDLADVLPTIVADRIDRGAGHSTMTLYLSSR